MGLLIFVKVLFIGLVITVCLTAAICAVARLLTDFIVERWA